MTESRLVVNSWTPIPMATCSDFEIKRTIDFVFFCTKNWGQILSHDSLLFSNWFSSQVLDVFKFYSLACLCWHSQILVNSTFYETISVNSLNLGTEICSGIFWQYPSLFGNFYPIKSGTTALESEIIISVKINKNKRGC